MKTQKVKISQIKLNPNNPRIIRDDNFAKLVKSVKDFPEMLNIRPIVVNKDMIILGGNMRYKACKEAGLKEIPIIITDLSEDKQREFLIKDNTSGGEWDWEVLTNEWDAEELSEWGLDLNTFQSSDINLDDFFEENNISEDKQEKFTITLEYSQEDYAEVIELFGKKTGSKEQIVFELLKK